eukprot:838769-Lingulodinium_polyedra.AAC.1
MLFSRVWEPMRSASPTTLVVIGNARVPDPGVCSHQQWPDPGRAFARATPGASPAPIVCPVGQ